MAITSFSHGARGIAGVVYNSNAWQTTDTAETIGASDGIELYLDQGWPITVPTRDEVAIAHGSTLQIPSVKTGEKWEGTFSTTCPYYMASHVMIANWWGTESTAQQGATAAYKHSFSFDEDAEGLVMSGGLSDRIRLREVPHFKAEKMKYIFEQGKVGRIEWGVVGKREIVDDSGTNGLAAFDAAVTFLTQPTIRYPIINSSQFVCRIRASADGALGADHKRYPERIELNFERNFKRFSRTDTGLYISEPVGGDWRLMGGQLDFPVDDTTADWAWLRDGTGLKMDITATGTLIEATYYYEMFWQYPYIELSGDGLPVVNTADVLTTRFPFIARTATAAPTGMTTTEPTMTITDVRTTDWITYT